MCRHRDTFPASDGSSLSEVTQRLVCSLLLVQQILLTVLCRVRENLGILIQAGGGSVGHSSVEDAVATLDLVRWYVLNETPPKAKPPPKTVDVP